MATGTPDPTGPTVTGHRATQPAVTADPTSPTSAAGGARRARTHTDGARKTRPAGPTGPAGAAVAEQPTITAGPTAAAG